jgi:hypothetical protein
MGERCRTFSLSRLNDDTPFGLYTQDRMIAFRFGVEVITVSCRSHVPWKRKSWVPKPHGTCLRLFFFFGVCVCVCVCVSRLALVRSSIPGVWMDFLHPWMTAIPNYAPDQWFTLRDSLLRTDSLNYSAPLCHRNIQCTYWTSLPTGMRVGTKACQSNDILLEEQANGAALFGRYAYRSPARLSVNGSSWNVTLPAVIALRKWNIVELLPVRNITLFQLVYTVGVTRSDVVQPALKRKTEKCAIDDFVIRDCCISFV